MTEGMITVISFVLTLMVFSYVLGDIPLVRNLYRTAIYIFVGMTAAFTTIVTLEGVLFPYLQDIQNSSTSWTVLGNVGDIIIFFTAVLFGLLLLLKPIGRLSWLTNSVFAVVIVVGAAVAVIGALTGTLFPLVRTSTAVPATVTSDPIALINVAVIFFGTLTSLMYFQYQATRDDDGQIKQGAIIRRIHWIGKVFIVTTLGAIYATAMLTSLTILTERIGFLLRFGG
jgi:hypothetical protein